MWPSSAAGAPDFPCRKPATVAADRDESAPQGPSSLHPQATAIPEESVLDPGWRGVGAASRTVELSTTGCSPGSGRYRGSPCSQRHGKGLDRYPRAAPGSTIAGKTCERADRAFARPARRRKTAVAPLTVSRQVRSMPPGMLRSGKLSPDDAWAVRQILDPRGAGRGLLPARELPVGVHHAHDPVAVVRDLRSPVVVARSLMVRDHEPGQKVVAGTPVGEVEDRPAALPA